VRAHAAPRLRFIASLCAAAVTAACGLVSPATPGARNGAATVAVPTHADALASALPQGTATVPAPDALAAAGATPRGPTASVGIVSIPFAGLDIHSVAFLPDGTGFLAAWHGAGCYGGLGACSGSILRSDDVGRSWSTVYTGGDYLQGLTLPDATHGWALGGSCSPEDPVAGCTSTLLATTSGGAEWHPVYSRDDALFTKVDFVDARHGWLGLRGGVVLGTQDGGRTWTPVHTPCATAAGLPNVGPFALTDTVDGWLACEAAGDGASVAKAIFGTGNGGQTWTRRSGAFPTSGGTVDIAFASPQVGWLCTWPIGGPLWITHDGGRTWGAVATGLNGANVVAIDPVTAAPEQVYAVVGLGQTATVLHSVDGGASWSSVYPRVGPFLGPGSTAAAVDFVGPREGYALGFPADPRGLVRTEDAGAHWLPVGRLPQGDTVIDWSFAPEGRGWIIAASAAGPPALLATEDAGRTWQGVPAAPSGTPRLARRSGANDGLVLVGDTLYTTTDAGAHFVRAGTVGGAQVITLPAAASGWAVVRGAVRHSTDGGQTWTAAAAVADGAEALSLSFPDARHGWVLAQADCAQDGACARRLWLTDNGGATWQALAVGALDAATVDFVDAADGWLTTRSGALYRSTDGGRNWLEMG